MYWWYSCVCSESLQQRPSNTYRQPFKVTVVYIFKETAWIRQITICIFSAQVYDISKSLHDLYMEVLCTYRSNFARSRRFRMSKKGHWFEPFMMDELPAPESVIELNMCSCKKTNCDSLRYNCKKKGMVCSDICQWCQCLNCLNVKFKKNSIWMRKRNKKLMCLKITNSRMLNTKSKLVNFGVFLYRPFH